MNFSEAIAALIAGNKIRRTDHNRFNRLYQNSYIEYYNYYEFPSAYICSLECTELYRFTLEDVLSDKWEIFKKHD